MSLEKRFQDALERLRKGLLTDRLAHCYLIVGPIRGVATQFSQQFLQLLFCEQKGQACGQCRQCDKVTSHSHPDIYWIEPQKKSRIIAIDQIRLLQRQIYQTSFEGGWKAALITGADRMNDEAGNALLKTLEEPPPRTVFLLLVSSLFGLLPTIISRCQRITLQSESISFHATWRDEILNVLQPRPDQGQTAAAMARTGCLIKLFKSIRADVEATLKEEERNVPASDSDQEQNRKTAEETMDARIEARFKEERLEVLRAMLGWYRDVLLIATNSADAGMLFFPKEIESVRKHAQRLTYQQALGNIQAIEGMERQLARISRSDEMIVLEACMRLSL